MLGSLRERGPPVGPKISGRLHFSVINPFHSDLFVYFDVVKNINTANDVKGPYRSA